jgi:hypothetical protein
MSKTDWDTCDQHEFTFPRHTECPYCRIAVLEQELRHKEFLAQEDYRRIYRKDARIAALQARLGAVKKVFAEAEDEDWVRKDWLEEALKKTDE